jgi:hypothetical protein
VLWTKHACSSLHGQPMCQQVKASCTLKDALATENQRSTYSCILFTQSRSHADDARSLGAHSGLLSTYASAMDIGAAIVSEMVRVKKVRLYCSNSSSLSTLSNNRCLFPLSCACPVGPTPRTPGGGMCHEAQAPDGPLQARTGVHATCKGCHVLPS